MIAAAGPVLQWLQLGCEILTFGILAFLLLAGESRDPAIERWRERLLQSAQWLVWVLIVSGVGDLAFQAGVASGRPQAVFEVEAWARLLLNTRFGSVWLTREPLAVLLLGMLLARRRILASSGRPGFYVSGLCIIGAVAGASAFAGHGAAVEPAWPAISLHVAHLLSVAAWLGGLLPLALLTHLAAREEGLTDRGFVVHAVQRFSVLAMSAMAVIVASGMFSAYLQVETFPALFGTRYGGWVLLKIALLASILAIAAKLRSRILPRWAAAPADHGLASVFARRGMLEFFLGMLIVGCASVLSETTPARHDQISWLLPFRFSVDATWNNPGVQWRVWLGGALAAAGSALGIFWGGRIFRGAAARQHEWRRIAAGGLLAVVGLILALPPLAVEAYPETYRRSDVPYEAISVANGERLFAEHCTQCHGAGGKGDGVRAASLPKKPANLTEPHTALHTAGDMFWWLTHGIPAGKMPGFAGSLSEEERWDLINFLRAFSAGFQARILGHKIVQNRPWLGAPNFSFVTNDGLAGTLKDYRGQKAVVLVFFSWPESGERLERLDQAYAGLARAGAEILAVPWEAAQFHAAQTDHASFPVIVQGNEEIQLTYRLFRRTLADAGTGGGPLPRHMEVLIDRFGYIRARWVQSNTSPGWAEVDELAAQVAQLALEKQILPPPDDHVH